MFNPLTVITVLLLYFGGLFAVALWGERSCRGKKLAGSAFIYSISLAVYCTSWTYYGSIGKAATSGMIFLTVYLGPTVGIILWLSILRKMIRLKNNYHISSIADFISARYDKSQTLAALVTLFAVFGIMPYIALQLKALTSTFSIIITDGNFSGFSFENQTEIIIMVLMIIFTIIFGLRKLDPTERHEGMVIVLALECLVKLIAFIVVGIFITFFIYGGMEDIFYKLGESNFRDILTVNGPEGDTSCVTWATYFILSMFAVILLPRQFHLAVIENSNENHIKTAIWLFPLYMFLINIFIIPVAAAGLLMGYPSQMADLFLLLLPLNHGSSWLVLLVFLGGFSAATGMIMVSSMTLSTMVTNHILMPLIEWIEKLAFLKKHLLKCKWITVVIILISGYWVEKQISDSYMLVNIGMISFVAVLQFAPLILGGLYWRRAGKIGALAGLSAGFFIWFYTQIIPSFARSGWIERDFVEKGPLGISFLKPEELFYLSNFDSISHTVFWSMVFNTGFYVLGSLYFRQSEEEENIAEEFVRTLSPEIIRQSITLKREAYINREDKKKEMENILIQYFGPSRVKEVIEKCIYESGLMEKERITITELLEFHNRVEKYLAGSIGTSTAREVIKKELSFSPRETGELSEVYSEILTDLRVTPGELRDKINYYQEREELLEKHAGELEEKIRERDEQIKERKAAEEKIKKLNEELEIRVKERTARLEAINKELEAFSYSVSHDLRAPLRSIKGFSLALMEDYEDKLDREGKDFLNRIDNATERMKQLIDALLDLSRVTRWEILRESVNLSLMAEEIIKELKEENPERKGEFIIKPDITITGDKRLLRLVMENLLGNSWKYTSPCDFARIEFGVNNEDRGPVYFIKDNGVGFDMDYKDKLFGVFQRLHPPEEFPGTGIGLATVQRIIHRHGGRVWCEGEVGKGSVFYFSIDFPEL